MAAVATGTAAAARAAADLVPEAEEWLARWIAIPSVSGSPQHAAAVESAARFVVARLRRFAAAVEVVPTSSGPIVLARVAGRDPSRPAVVGYGHLDVRPAGTGWHTPPFTPVRRGRLLFGRGASDDKGQLLAHLVAVEGWAAVGGPPTDVVLVIDGAEEIGSPGLAGALSRIRQPIGAVVLSDTRQARPRTPSLTVSQRGVITLSVTVDTAGPAVHAGRFGGAVLDPSLLLAGALARAERVVARLPADPAYAAGQGAAIRRAAGRAVREGDLDALTTTRASLAVTTLRAGGAPGAVPRAATAVLDVRLPPSMRPETVLPALVRALRAGVEPPVRVSVSRGHLARGFVAQHGARTLSAVHRACLAGFGQPAILVSSGGSIPAIGMLQQAFGRAPVLLGLGPADDRAHGPDEYLDLEDFVRSVRTAVSIYGNIACAPGPDGSCARGTGGTRHDARHLLLGDAERDRAYLRGLRNGHD